ncbi:MAG: DUF4331 domain-containing protein [Actinomycetota bacterium]|nr:DUF4331 domain-containing protein [Actinomycetota bacterium]
MSSHREAPESSKDPVADNTDVYVFVSPDRPDTVTIITNYIPFETPAGGPTFYEFGDDVQYRINIDNNGDGVTDIVYEFSFETTVPNSESFLYNTGPIESLDSPNFNRPQRYTVTEVRGDSRTTLGEDLLSPPCNVGFRSTPNYPDLANSAIHDLGDGMVVFAGQRLDGFFIDLGSIFDLAALRPFQNLHLISSAAAAGVNALRGFNVHSIAIQIPISKLTADGSVPTDPLAANSVIGVYAAADRQKGRFQDETQSYGEGPFTQVSRLAMPLFNEVLVPMARKDEWNRSDPENDSEFAPLVARPELANLLPVLYPDVFPNLAAFTGDRADLLAIFLTGIPEGIVPGFQNTTGSTQADLMRLNMAIPPSEDPNVNGLVAGDAAGFPNGRRVFDDIATVELRALAGLTIPLVDPSYVPDEAAGLITDGTQELDDVSYLSVFPYLDHPVSGYDSVPPSRSGLPQGK